MTTEKHESPAFILATLYNAARPQGMGFLHFDPVPITVEQAEKTLQSKVGPYFDYLKGRVMKIDVSREPLDTRLYNRDNGPGAAEAALEKARGES